MIWYSGILTEFNRWLSKAVDRQVLVFVCAIASAQLICACGGGCSGFATLVRSSYLCLEVEGDGAVNCVKIFDLKKRNKKEDMYIYTYTHII
jgi:citrate lyase synthetase